MFLALFNPGSPAPARTMRTVATPPPWGLASTLALAILPLAPLHILLNALVAGFLLLLLDEPL
eukprot:10513709-Alexandrium_andersonii.AAC.1